MRRARGLIHLLVCCALIWQGAAGALASAGMAAFEARLGGVLCQPSGGDPRSADPQAVADHALCALHCGALASAPPPAPARAVAPAAFTFARYEAASVAEFFVQRPALPPPARGPPVFS